MICFNLFFFFSYEGSKFKKNFFFLLGVGGGVGGESK